MFFNRRLFLFKLATGLRMFCGALYRIYTIWLHPILDWRMWCHSR